MTPRWQAWGGLFALLWSLVATPGANAEPLLAPPTVLRLAPPPGAADFGAAVAGLPDLDRDGIDDVIVGAPGSDHVYLISGATGAVLRHVPSPAGAGVRFGAAVAPVGDIDRDGVADVAVGAPPDPPPCQPPAMCPSGGAPQGRAFLFSGASGVPLQQLAPVAPDDLQFGRAVAGAGDLNGDSVPDILVGAPSRARGMGSVLAFSGASGAALWSRNEEPASFGHAVAASPDVSGDGVVEVLVSAVDAGPVSPPGLGQLTSLVPALLDRLLVPAVAERAFVLSGATGAVVRSIPDPDPHTGDAFGAGMVAFGDQDGDGVEDYLLGEPGANRLHLYSGDDGVLIRSLATPGTAQGQALAVGPVDDTDGDGRDDAWIGLPATRSVHLVNGMGRVLASQSSPSPQGAFGAAIGTIRTSSGAVHSDVIVGDPAEPGGGAAYLLRVRPATGLTDLARVRVQAQTPPTTIESTVPASTTSVPATATLPKPASAAVDQPTHPGTGAEDRLLVGLCALALGMAGLTLFRRARARGEPG